MEKLFTNCKLRLNDADIERLGEKPHYYRFEDIVLYNSYKKDDRGILSNFYTGCGIQYDGREFHSAEQMLFYSNAVRWGKGFEEQGDVIDEIFKCQCGRDVKNNKKIKEFHDKIDEVREDILGYMDAHLDSWMNVYNCLWYKYKYCKEFRDVLNGYCDRGLKPCEHCIWKDNYAGVVFDKETGLYKGMNICGRAMLAVYEDFKEGRENRVEGKLREA
jgi:hypothetical protein